MTAQTQSWAILRPGPRARTPDRPSWLDLGPISLRLIILVCLAVAPLLVAQLYGDFERRSNRKDEIERLSARLTTLVGAEIDQITEGARQLSSAIAEALAIAKSDQSRCGPLLRRLLQQHPRYRFLVVVDGRGNKVCTAPAGLDVFTLVEGRAFRDATVTGEFAIGDYLYEDGGSLVMAHPIRNGREEGEFVVITGLSLEWLNSVIAQRKLPDASVVIVTDRNGTLIARRPRPDWVGKRVSPQIKELLAANSDGVATLIARDGRTWILGYLPPDKKLGRGLLVAAGIDYAAAFASLNAASLRDVTVSAIILVLAITAALLFGGHFIRRPIDRLLATAARWSAGEWHARAGMGGGSGEIERLARAFDAMADAVGSRERSLVRATEEAVAASRAKSDFLANMSHELRTPLNAILGFSDIMRTEMMGPLSPRYRSYACDIHSSADHLLRLINELLDVSKLEAGKLELHEEIFRLCDLVNECAHLIRQRAEKARLDVSIEVPRCEWIQADRLRLKQVLINLLSNAVKFTPAGGRVGVRTVERADAIRIEVFDTGIGMRPEDIPIALEPFRQIDDAFNRRYEGTGLGLTLARRLTELHGGRLEIESAPGRGTRVRIDLPKARLVQEASRNDTQPKLSC